MFAAPPTSTSLLKRFHAASRHPYLTKQDAERFANYLLSLGISSKVEPAADAWAIWVRDENQLPRSKQELEQFQPRPRTRSTTTPNKAARKVRREADRQKATGAENYVDMRDHWASPMRRRPRDDGADRGQRGGITLHEFGAFSTNVDLLFSLPADHLGRRGLAAGHAHLRARPFG